MLAVAGAAAIAAGPIMSRVEQPEYKVTATDGAFELREYAQMIAAEATVEGEREAAIRQGFRLIADYIFGANKPNAKIAMTAPVEQQQQQTIAMTAPVTQQAEGSKWTVRFIMPKSWTLETLPTPNDQRVSLKPIEARSMAVLQFSGRATDAAIAARTDELKKAIAARSLKPAAEPVLAFYNPPWTLPMFRRNEVMIEVVR